MLTGEVTGRFDDTHTAKLQLDSDLKVTPRLGEFKVRYDATITRRFSVDNAGVYA